MDSSNLPLGQSSDYPQNYAPDVLCPVSRDEARRQIGLGHPLPFDGVDAWNAWELTWLGPDGMPQVAAAELRVPATSPNLVESKSLKLYLGSFAMTRFDSPGDVVRAIETDLAACAGSPVAVTLDVDAAIADLDGRCLDTLGVENPSWEVDPDLLVADAAHPVSESLHTHLLRSLCPVTGQPDLGSLEVSYTGPRIDPEALLRYVLSYRQHNDFHEACVERMFVDIEARCRPAQLTVCARYQRRGGIDINPWRTNCGATPGNRRLWRQ